MVFLCFCWFLVLYSATFILSKNKDLFSPLKFISVKYGLLNLLFILYIAFYPESFDKHILKVCNVTLEEAFWQYTRVQTVAYLCLVSGMLVLNYKKETKFFDFAGKLKYRSLKILSVLAFLVGLSAYGIFLKRIGGLLFLLNNLHRRVELQGNQYVLGFLPLMALSCLAFLLCIKIKNRTADKVLFGAATLLTLFVFNSLGGRLPSIILLITLIVGWHYIIAPLKFNLKNALRFGLLGVIMIFYVLVVPELRKGTAATSKNPYRAKVLVYNISYTYIDVFAANYFNGENAWRLKGFFEPVTALFAKDDKSNIPQVDQGVYFYSIVKYQKNFAPPLPRKDVSKVSWPTENFGFAFANFLLPGIVVFFFLQGLVFSLVYRVLINSNFHPVLIMLYADIVFNFNFSSIRLAYFIKIVPLLYICYVVFNKFVRKQNIADSFKIKF